MLKIDRQSGFEMRTGDLEKTTYINKPKPCVDGADCENFKALFGIPEFSDRSESKDRCSKSPSKVHLNT